MKKTSVLAEEFLLFSVLHKFPRKQKTKTKNNNNKTNPVTAAPCKAILVKQLIR